MQLSGLEHVATNHRVGGSNPSLLKKVYFSIPLLIAKYIIPLPCHAVGRHGIVFSKVTPYLPQARMKSSLLCSKQKQSKLLWIIATSEVLEVLFCLVGSLCLHCRYRFVKNWWGPFANRKNRRTALHSAKQPLWKWSSTSLLCSQCSKSPTQASQGNRGCFAHQSALLRLKNSFVSASTSESIGAIGIAYCSCKAIPLAPDHVALPSRKCCRRCQQCNFPFQKSQGGYAPPNRLLRSAEQYNLLVDIMWSGEKQRFF